MWAEHNSTRAKNFRYKVLLFSVVYCALQISENESDMQVLFLQRSVANRDFRSQFGLIAAFWSVTE